MTELGLRLLNFQPPEHEVALEWLKAQSLPLVPLPDLDQMVVIA